MQCLKESLLVINLSKSNHVVITLLHNPVYWKMMLCLLLLCFKAGNLVVLLLLWVILYWCQCKFKKKNYMLVVLKLRKVYVACCVRHDADGWTNWVLYAEPAFILLTLCACVCVCAQLLDALSLFHVWPCRGPSQCSLCPCDASSVFNFWQSSGIVETLTKMLILKKYIKKQNKI